MENTVRGKRSLAIAACLVMILGMGLPVLAGAATAHPASPSAVSGSTTLAGAGKPNYPTSPHAGQLIVDDDFGGSIATTEDPAVDYETIGYEAIMNTFETLIGYNGSASTGGSPQAFVPVLATCVPGTVQCTTDYGSSLVVNNGAGQPQYYTFVIDPAAHFYDPATGKSWHVYPSDVMFSLARDMAWSETDGVGTTAGWLIAQMLLPNGTTGIQVPYDTTPANILGSLLINDSNYCPANAMNGLQGNGCITFNVDGQGAAWPTTLFLQEMSDGFTGVQSCAWYSHNGANVTGWDSPDNGTGPDSSCLLPDGQTTTDNSDWTSYLASLSPTFWNNYEELLPDYYPAPNPAVQWTMVGSGPYYASMDPSGSPPGYSLAVNPGYAQPSGCSGANGLATYPASYCDPAPGSYIGTVNVRWYSTDTPALSGFREHAIDFGGIPAADTPALQNLSTAGDLQYLVSPTLNPIFLAFNLNYSLSAYETAGFTVYGTPNVPADFLSGEAVRMLLTHAYEYATAEQQAWTVDGVPYLSPAGGPIARGMNYYPTNVSYPSGNAGTNASVFGSAAWWWAQGTNPSSPYYDSELAACTPSQPCKFDIFSVTGEPGTGASLSLLLDSLKSISGGALQPFTDSFSCFSGCCSIVCVPFSPAPSEYPFTAYTSGWGADNFDPEDYLIPLAFPNSTFTYPDTIAQQFELAQYDDTAVCGNYGATLANLTYWAKQPALNNSCEGVAYNVVKGMFYNSTHETNDVLRGQMYWAIQEILNGLGLYIWYGQSNLVESFAPWIDASSVNTNPTIGGGDDQLWFQVRYVPYETVTTFTEKGLPSGSTFNVTASSNGGPGVSNTSNGTAATSFFEPNGTLSYTFTAPAGYAVSAVAGPKGTTTESTTISGSAKGTALTVTFVPLETLSFTETGLAPGTSWDVSITWAKDAKTGPPNGNPADGAFSANTTGSSISFGSIAKGSWTYVVSVPTDYKVNSAKGSAAAPTTKALKFTLVTAKYVFSEKGLAKGDTWGVTVTGATNATTVCSMTGTKSSFTCVLESGTYDFTVASVNGYTAAPASGSFTVAAPKGATEKITYTAT